MSQMQALIGETLGTKYPYRIESVLGSGAMGVVYRGTDQKRGRPVAVKVVSGEIAQGGKVQKRFEREAEILQQFRHPSIVRFLGYGKFRGTYYIAMEFIQGITLEKLLSDSGPLPWREVVDLAIQVCDALHYAHERGVVHRDLKPSNLMITEDRKVKLTDFGIAKDLDATTADGHRPDAGHRRVHGPRADPRHAGGQPQDRPLRAGGLALPVAHRPGPLRGDLAGGPDALPPERAAASPQRQGAGDPPRAGRPGRRPDGQDARRAAVGRRGRPGDPDGAPRQGRSRPVDRHGLADPRLVRRRFVPHRPR